jgi:hypothetical protein
MFHDYNQLAGFLVILILALTVPAILLFFAVRFLTNRGANEKFENNLPKIIDK